MRGKATLKSDGRIQTAGTQVEDGIPLPSWAEVRDLPRLRWTGAEWIKEPKQ